MKLKWHRHAYMMVEVGTCGWILLWSMDFKSKSKWVRSKCSILSPVSVFDDSKLSVEEVKQGHVGPLFLREVPYQDLVWLQNADATLEFVCMLLPFDPSMLLLRAILPLKIHILFFTTQFAPGFVKYSEYG